MTAPWAGALIDDAKQWTAIKWHEERRQIRRLQMRIAKAIVEGNQSNKPYSES